MAAMHGYDHICPVDLDGSLIDSEKFGSNRTLGTSHDTCTRKRTDLALPGHGARMGRTTQDGIQGHAPVLIMTSLDIGWITWVNCPMVPDWCDLCHRETNPRYRVESDNPLIKLVCDTCRTIYFPVPHVGETDITLKSYETESARVAYNPDIYRQ